MENFDAGVSYAVFFGLILFISAVFGAFKEMDKKKKEIYLFVVFAIFFFVMGYRSYEMGNDTISYIEMFYWISAYSSPFECIKRSRIEFGYIIYNWLISKTTDDYQVIFILASAFFNISIGRFACKYADNPGIFCCAFVGLMQFDFFVSALRQGITVAILLFVFDDIMNSKKFRAALLCLIAVAFHTSALVMFIVFPLLKEKEDRQQSSNVRLYFGMLVLVFVISLFFDKIFAGVLRVLPQYSHYLGSELTDGEPRLAVFLKIIVYLLLFIVPKLFGGEKQLQTRTYIMGEKMAFVNLMFIIIAHNATALMRLATTFGLFATMHYSNNFKRLNEYNRKALLFLTILCIFIHGLVIVVLKTPEWQTTYPIKLIF